MKTASWRTAWVVACAVSVAGLLACGKTSGPGDEPGDDGGSSGGRSGTGGGSSSGGRAKGGSGGAGGDGGPITTNTFVETINQKTVDKLDLLFVIDNSISMADKQAVLKDAVPDLVRRFLAPNCIRGDGTPAATPDDPADACPSGSQREFAPIRNVHVGVITSSIGGHGSPNCDGSSPGVRGEQENDHGHLIATRPRFSAELAKYPSAEPPDARGFLDWSPAANGGTQDIGGFTATFQAMVTAAGEFGCGYESQLESVFRFLSDPNPYERIDVASCSATNTNPCAFKTGIDQELLVQRKAFLRPDSAVGVVLISDENDCSIIESDQGYYAARADDIDLPRSTAICATNPNDECCVSCISPTPPGCAPDPACTSNPVTPEEFDPPNLRCFNQKRRFGIDFLYPTSRYVNALTQRQLCTASHSLSVDAGEECGDKDGDSTPDLFTNPLYDDLTGSGAGPRDPALVFFASVVGVPWQDIQAVDRPDGVRFPPGELHYKSAAQLLADGAWDKILGNPTPPNGAAPVPPTNALMIESLNPRGGNDGQGNPLAAQTSPALANPVNSHEWGNTRQDDLQYACIFPLPEPRDCGAVAGLPDPQPGCDCDEFRNGDNNPLCQNPANDAYGRLQFFAKAYPGLRELEVTKGVGENGIVASICARNLTDPSAQDYGYRPAVTAIVDKMSQALVPRCLPRAILDVEQCTIVEVRPAGSGCDADRGREAVDDEELAQSVNDRLHADGVCGSENQPSCSSFQQCKLAEAGSECHRVAEQPSAGWCYIDPASNPSDDPALVESCPANQKRILRFVDPENRTPEADARVVIACKGVGTTTRPQD